MYPKNPKQNQELNLLNLQQFKINIKKYYPGFGFFGIILEKMLTNQYDSFEEVYKDILKFEKNLKDDLNLNYKPLDNFYDEKSYSFKCIGNRLKLFQKSLLNNK